jgi:peroxiredoxin (alkyl hydroperoxide reductase subunit C)
MLSIGAEAPDFALPNQDRQTVRLSDFKGRQLVVLAFHPLAFTPVCAVQMQNYEKAQPRLSGLNARVFGISVDAGPAKKAWADALGGISYDLLADFHPKGAVAEAYGVMRDDGISERAIFVVGLDGRIAWAKQYAIPDQPPIAELLEALERLRPGD